VFFLWGGEGFTWFIINLLGHYFIFKNCTKISFGMFCMDFFVCLTFLVGGFLSFFMHNFNYIVMLLSIESIMLSLIFRTFCCFIDFPLYFYFLVVVLVVCIGGYGVSLLVGYSCYVGRGSYFF
jgi:hypothetical protein